MAKAIVTGWKELDKAFGGLEVKIQGKVLRGAMRAGAQRIQAAAVAYIVSNPSIDEGDLAKSLKVRAAKRSRRSIGMQVVTKGAAHANLVEYGTKNMPPEPFLRRAGYDNKAAIQKMLLDDVAEAARSPVWTFKKTAAMSVTQARRAAANVVRKNIREKKKAAKRRAAR